MTRPVFEVALTAAPEHIDELGHVNNAVWVQWIQQVAVSHWVAVADAAHKDAYYWVVVRHEIDYLRAAFAGDRIVARTCCRMPRTNDPHRKRSRPPGAGLRTAARARAFHGHRGQRRTRPSR